MPARSRGARPPKGHALFAKFLKDHDISYAKAGRDLRVSRVTAYHWAIGLKEPTEENQRAIDTWTKGAVPTTAWPAHEAKRVVPFTGTDG